MLNSETVTTRILITGGGGFLGKRLRAAFEDIGVITFSYDILNGEDITNTVQFKDSCLNNQVQQVIHLAAQADLNLFAKSPELSHQINVEGTRNILTICNELGLRMLFASTCCCYGNNHIHPSDEDSMIAPTEDYAKSKALSEQDILKNDPLNHHVIMRLATFYGPQMRPALAPAIFIQNAYDGKNIQIHGDGNQTRTLTYVDDIVSGIIAIVMVPHRLKIVNVTNEEEVSVNQMAQNALNVTGQDVPIHHVEDRKGQIFKEQISNSRLRSLGWKPKINFKEGMLLSFEYFKENNYRF